MPVMAAVKKKLLPVSLMPFAYRHELLMMSLPIIHRVAQAFTSPIAQNLC